jgi:hypothetical protein
MLIYHSGFLDATMRDRYEAETKLTKQDNRIVQVQVRCDNAIKSTFPTPVTSVLFGSIPTTIGDVSPAVIVMFTLVGIETVPSEKRVSELSQQFSNTNTTIIYPDSISIE